MSVNSKIGEQGGTNCASFCCAQRLQTGCCLLRLTCIYELHEEAVLCAEEVTEANEEEQAAWRTAWRAIGSHAWRLLEQGHLKAAARLGRALADVGASLSALLVSCPEGKREGLPSPAVCLSGAWPSNSTLQAPEEELQKAIFHG